MGNTCCRKGQGSLPKESLKTVQRSPAKPETRRSTVARPVTYNPDDEKIEKYLIKGTFKSLRKIKDITEHYQYGKTLGKGAFGEVLQAKEIHFNFDCAIKIVTKRKLGEADVYLKLMRDELKTLQEIPHPHIMRTIELLEDEDNYYVVSEFIRGGELFDRIIKLKRFDENRAADVIEQLLMALNYLHKEKKIMHRDLKPENILLESPEEDNLNIKVSDFGFATKIVKGENLQCGSPLYMAPEILMAQAYDEKVDIWSTGVIAYILLSGKPPYFGKTKPAITNQIRTKELDVSSQGWEKISNEAKEFIKKALNKSGRERASAQELLNHPWISQRIKRQSQVLDTATQISIASNLQEFKRTNTFQSGIISLMANLSASEEELSTLKKMFNSLDKDKGGTLDIKEIKEGISEIEAQLGVAGNAGRRRTAKEYQDLMTSMDKDGDGQISYDEFIAAAINKVALLNENNIKSAFEMIDLDGNGQLTIEELKTAFEVDSTDGASGDLWTDIIKEVDKDGDGQISYKEFQAAMTEVLKNKYKRAEDNRV